ncbi:MAG: amino acid adenylation domain-containing protein [Acidimicrobiia bacterium]|nr:amino acid adenylation domain-containing protein [Acidimicrobiia bacterium]
MNDLLHQLLENSTARTPDHAAIVDGDRSLTYRELDQAANRVANTLIGAGVNRGDRVGVFAQKGIETVVSLYGAMKAGAAYVPIDPASPPVRAAYIVENCGIRHLVTSAKLANAWGELSAAGATTIIAHDADEATAAPHGADLLDAGDINASSDKSPDVAVIDEDLAVMLYTSGSTGQPKGVMLSHRNVMTFVKWAVEEYGITADDKLTQMAPLHFDLSTFDLYGAAFAGATVHMVPRRAIMFPMEIRNLIENNDITVMYAVPSILTMMVDHAKMTVGDLPSLKTILFAGEVFPTKYLSRLMHLVPHVAFANLYGPTETNVCTAYRVPAPPDEDAPPASIGKAIANVDTFVVTDEGTLAEPGTPGELFVRGGSVMKGYWGDAERTARTRIPNPFGGELDDPVYKTGDLVIEEPDGNYTFLGRRDAQIKSRGYRIELGEIETAINAHISVVECAVIAIPDDKITNRIKAVVSAAEDLTRPSLMQFIAERIPKYMIPGEFDIRTETLPKTSTGKIDRKSLESSELEEK